MIFLTRSDLQQAFPQAGPKVILALEQLLREQNDNSTVLTTGAQATKALQDATVVTLSPNDAFTNERVIASGQGMQLTDTGNQLIIAMVANLIVNGNYRLTINLPADTDLSVSDSGTLMVEEGRMDSLATRNFANDAAAAIGGIPVHGLYHNAGAVRLRLS